MSDYKEYRCDCHKLLFRGNLTGDTAVEVKCKRCGSINTYAAS